MERHSWLAVALCWAVAIIMSFTPVLGWNDQPAANSSSSSSSVLVCRFTAVISKSYLVYFTFFLCNLLPLSTMALLYCGIFCAIRRRLGRDKQRGSRGPGAGPESRGYLKRERRLAASLALVLALFALSWLPLHVINCVEYFGGGAVTVPVAGVYVGILLTHANSAVNPVVYAFRIPKVKQGYLRMWSRVVARRGSNQPPSSQSLDIVVSSHDQIDKC
ncbi:hypothetical protein CRUP_030483 [Coryphaenoides rupestris]|nr:hypothetical protein CRUP_030479 [Coryphaenoides rupestris]KAG7263362.1 hypothetical protein CRUP_030483 [Coryphaenoides rupestris]